MNFDFSDDQHQIKRTAHDLLAARATPEKVREAAEGAGYDEALWDELRGLGWPGIAISEEHGGQGLGTVELSILLEELGYTVVGSPLLSMTASWAFCKRLWMTCRSCVASPMILGRSAASDAWIISRSSPAR